MSSRQIGLQHFTIAELTADTQASVTYKAPVVLERAVTAKVSVKSDSQTLYSDDSAEAVLNTFQNIDVEIEVNALSLESRALLQGAKVSNGCIVEGLDNKAPELALGFKSKKADGTYRYVWLLKGVFEISDLEFETIADKVSPKTATLKATFIAREHDSNYRIIADEEKGTGSGNTGNTELLSKWFDAVPTIDKTTGAVTAGTATSHS